MEPYLLQFNNKKIKLKTIYGDYLVGKSRYNSKEQEDEPEDSLTIYTNGEYIDLFQSEIVEIEILK